MLFLFYSLQGDRGSALHLLTEDFKASTRLDLQYSWFMADGYYLLNNKAEALDWLEHTIDKGFVNYPFLSKIDPFLSNIRGDERFKELMVRVKHEWEDFEV